MTASLASVPEIIASLAADCKVFLSKIPGVILITYFAHFTSLAQSSPPVITNFLQKDLVNPEDVKAQAKVGFRLPCKATGSNLKWIWKHNGTAIAAYNERPFTLSEDGTLTGSYLRVADSGTYQCFVRDEQTGAVAFSRKLKVAVTGKTKALFRRRAFAVPKHD